MLRRLGGRIGPLFLTHAATWLLLSLAGVFVAAWVLSPMTWERPVSYLIAAICLLIGSATLIRWIVQARGHKVAILTLTFLYEKLPLMLILFLIFFETVNEITEASVFFTLDDNVFFALILAAFWAMAVSNLVLFVGWLTGKLFYPLVDAVPFRELWRSLARRNRR